MNFDKIKKDFEKRYEKECSKIFVTGLPVTFFENNSERVYACLSIGEAMAISPREDGRITVQYSDSDYKEMFNIFDVERHQDYMTARLMLCAKKCGGDIFGADIFIYKNTAISELFCPLVIGGLSSFCKNPPPPEQLLLRFENCDDNISCLYAKAGCAAVFSEQRRFYLPFPENFKVVVTYTGEDCGNLARGGSKLIKDGILSLKRGNWAEFFRLLNCETERSLKECKRKKLSRLFEIIIKSGEARGSGLIRGGIFSVVENERVDIFIRDVMSEYRKFCGGAPDFYVTELGESGYFY